MKTVFVVRHSKAEQNFISSDFERKLTEKGIANSHLVANRFFEKSISIDAFISSSAFRAKETAEIFAKTAGLHLDTIVYHKSLYQAPKEIYYQFLTLLPSSIRSVMLFAHNPGITEFINSLQIVQLDNMPTTGIFGFTIEADEWDNFATAKKSFILFDFPKA